MPRLVSRQYRRPIAQVGRTEKAVGAVLLLLTFGLLGAFVSHTFVAGERQSPLANRPLAPPTSATDPVLNEAHRAGVAASPTWSRIAVSGWQAPEKVSRYTRENLYVKIDGQAPAYINAGFVSLLCGTFTSKSQPHSTIDVYCYDMGDAAHATAIYGSEAPPAMTTIGIGDEAYFVSGAVFFRRDRFYVQVLASGASESEVDAVQHISRRLDEWIGAPSSQNEQREGPGEGTSTRD